MNKICLLPGDCRKVIKKIENCSIDSCVTDPPYSLVSIKNRFGKAAPEDSTLTSERARNRADQYARASAGFMSKAWDTGEVVHDQAFWAEILRVLKPGAHLVAFGGTRTYHRMVCAIEDAGFEVRDTVCWLYGTGFPKSHDVSKGIDRAVGVDRTVVGSERVRDIRNGHGRGMGDGINASERDGPEYYERDLTEASTPEAREWTGWGTALKPAFEPIVLARKPLSEGTVAANVLRYGTGAINIDGCRIGTSKRVPGSLSTTENSIYGKGLGGYYQDGTEGGHDPNIGRWPANVCHDGSDEVLAAFPESAGQLQDIDPFAPSPKTSNVYGKMNREGEASAARRYTEEGATNFSLLPGQRRGDSGSAARFFFSAKAGTEDRFGSKHPTVKPIALMRWLVKLVTPPRGTILDPFAGTGTTGIATIGEGFNAILIEREPEYIVDIKNRIAFYEGNLEARAPQRKRDEPKNMSGTIFDGL